MSLPKPIYVSPSTTFVQVDPLQSPYNPVILNSVVYPGQVVSVRDATSSFGVLTTPIVLSTILNNSFQDGSISTLINQPQGFITAQSYSSNTWAFLNSFPFRNQNLSANVQNLTTSTLFTAIASTVQEYVNTLQVENLLVTGNFVQTQGIVLNTNVSSLGTVEFTSSLSVWGNAYFSSDVTILGTVNLYSSLQVKGNLLAKSTLTTLSSAHVSSFLVAVGSLSTPLVSLQGGLAGTSLYVLGSQPVNVAGNIAVQSSIIASGSLSVGGPIQTKQFITLGNGNAFFGSSASLYQNVTMSTFSTAKEISSAGSFGAGELLVVTNLTAENSVKMGNLQYVKDLFTIGGTLITSTLVTNILETYGDYRNLSTSASISSLSIQTNLNAGYITASSTFIGGNVSTSGLLGVGKDLTIPTNLLASHISTSSNVAIGNHAFVDGNFQTNTMFGSTFLSNAGIGIVGQSTIISRDSAIAENLSAEGNLIVGGKLITNTFNIPADLVTYDLYITGPNYYVRVGSEALFNQGTARCIQTSTFTYGAISNTRYPFDTSKSLVLTYVGELNSAIVSTGVYQVLQGDYEKKITAGGMGIGVEPQPSLLVSQPLAYFLSSPVYAQTAISTLYVKQAEIIQASTLIGDASFLKVGYPQQLSCLQLFVTDSAGPLEGAIQMPEYNSLMYVNQLQAGSVTQIGTLVNESTLTVGSLNFWGNAETPLYNEGSNIIQTAVPNTLLVNDVKFIGDGTGTVKRRMAINEDIMGGSFTASLGVFNSLAIEALDDNIDLVLTYDTLRAKKIVASNLYGDSLYISSGNISTSAGKFFIGESETYDDRYNTIQPLQSTLSFNNVLFVNRKISSVGVNNALPNFDLDLQKLRTTQRTFAGQNSFVKNQISYQPSSLLYFAFINSNTTYSNIVYTSDPTSPLQWQNISSNFYPPGSDYIYNSVLSVGLPSSNNSNLYNSIDFLQTSPQLFFYGTQVFPNFQSTMLVARAGTIYNSEISILPSLLGGFAPFTTRSMATDGKYVIATGTFPDNLTPPVCYTNIDNGNVNNELFNVDYSAYFLPTYYGSSNGGYAAFYGGSTAPVWLVGGAGANTSLFRAISLTGFSNWTSIAAGINEIRAFASFQVPYATFSNGLISTLTNNGGQTVILAAGGDYYGYAQPVGKVSVSYDLGLTWTASDTIFEVGYALSIATDGKIVVVGGEDRYESGNTLFYSPIGNGNNFTWTRVSGDAPQIRVNTVIWSGTQWLAGGDSGLYVSLDGSNWGSLPTLGSIEVFGLACISNINMAIDVTGSGEASDFRILESPYPASQNLLPYSTCTLSVFSNSYMNINNACSLDSNQNMIVPTFASMHSLLENTNYQSTLFTTSAYISTVLSTNKLTVGRQLLSVQVV